MAENRIDNLSAEEITALAKKQELLTAAENDVFAIRDVFVFRMGETWREISAISCHRVHQAAGWKLSYNCEWELDPRGDFRFYEPFKLKISKESLFDFYTEYSEIPTTVRGLDGYRRHCYDQFQEFMKYTRLLPKYQVPYKNML